MQSLDRASPYKTLLTTQPPHPGLPILGDPRAVSWIWRKCLVESRIAQRINVLSDFFKWLLICISLRYDLRLNLSLTEIWQKCYFLYLLRNWHYAFSSPEPVVSWSRGRETRVGYKLSRVALGTRMGTSLRLKRFMGAMTKHKLVMRSSLLVRHCCERVPSFKQNAGLFGKRSKEN